MFMTKSNSMLAEFHQKYLLKVLLPPETVIGRYKEDTKWKSLHEASIDGQKSMNKKELMLELNNNYLNRLRTMTLQ